MLINELRHIHARRRHLSSSLKFGDNFELWEETCVPSYCHPNLAAAYVSWWRLYAAAALARQVSNCRSVLDFGASVGELRHLLADGVQRYDFIEENDVAAKFLHEQAHDATRQTLASAQSGEYSCVFALDSLEHNTDYPELLRALAEKLAPDGVMIISGPTESRLYRLGRRIAGFDAHYHETNIYAIERVALETMQKVGRRSLPPLAPLFRITALKKRPAATG